MQTPSLMRRFLDGQEPAPAAPEAEEPTPELIRRFIPTTGERIRGLGYRLARGLGTGLRVPLELPATLLEPVLPNWMLGGARLSRTVSQELRKSVERVAPKKPEAAQGALGEVAEALGSTLPMTGAMIASGGAVAPMIATGVIANGGMSYFETLAQTGSQEQAQWAADQVRQTGGNEADAQMAFSQVLEDTGDREAASLSALWNGLIGGPTEVFGIGAAAGGLAKVLGRVAAGPARGAFGAAMAKIATEEAAQEGFQELVAVVGEHLIVHEDDRALWEEIVEQQGRLGKAAALGGTLGVLLGGPLEVASRALAPRPPGEPQETGAPGMPQRPGEQPIAPPGPTAQPSTGLPAVVEPGIPTAVPSGETAVPQPARASEGAAPVQPSTRVVVGTGRAAPPLEPAQAKPEEAPPSGVQETAAVGIPAAEVSRESLGRPPTEVARSVGVAAGPTLPDPRQAGTEQGFQAPVPSAPEMPRGFTYAGTLRGPEQSYALAFDREGHLHHIQDGKDVGSWPIAGRNAIERIRKLVAEEASEFTHTFEPAEPWREQVEAMRVDIAKQRQQRQEREALERRIEERNTRAESEARAEVERRFAAATRGWKKGSFSFTTSKGEKLTEPALVSPSGLFTVRKVDDKWVVSHVPSGLAAGRLVDQAAAKALAARLEAVPGIDWKSTTPVKSGDAASQRAAEILRAVAFRGAFEPSAPEIEEHRVRLEAAEKTDDSDLFVAAPSTANRPTLFSQLPRSLASPAPELVEEIDEDDERAKGGTFADPSELPSSMQAGYPADPILGGGASPRAPVGDRIYGRLEAGPGKPGKRVSTPEIIGSLAKVVESVGGKTPIRFGRMGTARARGLFKVQPEVIRVKTANNVATAIHEVGHALEKHVYGDPKSGVWKKPIVGKAMQQELVKLGKALYGETKPAAGYKSEGFAEFLRLWVSNREQVKKDAPLFSGWFAGEFLKGNPELAAAVEHSTELVTRWGEQGSLERARASVIDPASWGEKWKKTAARLGLARLKHAWIEMGEALIEFTSEAERRLGKQLDPEESPSFLFQALRMTHSARVRRMVNEGMLDLWSRRVGPALNEIRPLVGGRYDDFAIFLWAKRAKALWNDPIKGPRNPGLPQADADQILATLSSDKFELAASKVYEWQEGILSYAAQASPSFRRVVDAIRAVDPGNYVPLQREFSALDSLWSDKKRRAGVSSGKGIVAALKGSGRRIKDPLQVILANAERTVLAAHRRAILDAILKLGNVEGMGHLIEEVPKDQVPFSVDLEQVIRAIAKKQPGVLAEDVSGPLAAGDFVGEALTFFAPAQYPKGEDPVIPVWDPGTKQSKWYWLDHRLAETLAGLDVARLPKMVDIFFGIPTRLMRAGTTGLRASFGLITNPLRDAQTLWVNTQGRSWAPQLLARYLIEMGRAAVATSTGGKYESAYLQAFRDLGGEMAQPLGQDSSQVQRAARELVQSGKWRYLDPRNWLEFYRDLVQFPESAARTTELRNLADEIGWKPGTPMTPNQALQLLLASKQVTTDFTAAGSLARVANQVIPFFNAAIQGPRAALRAAQRNPGRFGFRGLQLAAATLALWWSLKDEEWYRELAPEKKFMFWHIPLRWRGRDEVVAIPRPFETGGVFAALPEMLMDAWYRQEPATAAKWAAQFFEVLNPIDLPPTLKEPAEQLANRDFFWGTPIVPTGEARRPAGEQFNEYTSRVAIFLGQMFDVSPRRIDHAIRGTMGGVAQDVVAVLGLGPQGQTDRESELADVPVLGRLFQRGGPLGMRPASITKIYDELEDARTIQASEVTAESEDQRQRRLLLEDAAEALSALSYVRSQTDSVDERRRLTIEMLKLAKDALDASRMPKVDRRPVHAFAKQAAQRKVLAESAAGAGR